MKILEGITGLLASRKGTLCLLILGASTYGLMTKSLDGTAFAAVVATISTIFMYTQHKTDIANINNQAAINNAVPTAIPVTTISPAEVNNARGQ